MLSALIQEAEQQQKDKQNMGDISHLHKGLAIVLEFVQEKKRIMYGGTAINNILPSSKQFYSKTDVPDYDFMSPQAIKDTIVLTEKLRTNGYRHVQVKPSIHHGTYKVLINFVPVADVTQVPPMIYKKLVDMAIVRNSVHYMSPLLLKLGIFIELSRPNGDVSRWQKSYDRLQLLEDEYPTHAETTESGCDANTIYPSIDKFRESTEHFYHTARICCDYASTHSKTCCVTGSVVRDVYASAIYSHKKAPSLQDVSQRDFILGAIEKNKYMCELISTDAHETAHELRSSLQGYFQHAKFRVMAQRRIGEYIDTSYKVMRGNTTYCYVYQTTECHGVFPIKYNRGKLSIASLETALTFAIPNILDDTSVWSHDGLLCLCNEWMVLRKDWKRYAKTKKNFTLFALECIGYQTTKLDIIRNKHKLRKKYRNQAKNREFYEHFFRVYSDQPLYVPKEVDSSN